MAVALTVEDKELIEAKILVAIDKKPRLTMRDAAKIAGISHAKLYKMFEENPDFEERIRQAQVHARRAAVDNIEESLYTRALDPRNPTGATAGIFLLKANRPEIYADKAGLLNTGTVINIGSITVVPREAPAELPAIDVDPLPPAA